MGPRRLIANVKDLRRPVILAQHVLICREADSLSHCLLMADCKVPTLALGGAHVCSRARNVWQAMRQLAGILHSNQSTPLEWGTTLGAAVNDEDARPISPPTPLRGLVRFGETPQRSFHH